MSDTTETFCGVFDLMQRSVQFNEPWPRVGFVNGIKPQTWWCPHGLICFVPGENQVEELAHEVDPSLVGYVYEVTSIAGGG